MTGRAGLVAGALFARLQPYRAVLVKDQELPAWGEVAHRGGARQGAGACHRTRDESRHPRLVQALWLLARSHENRCRVYVNQC